MMATSSAANRGKYAEGEVKKYLKLLESSHMDFTFNRNPDAHAAGGKFVPVAGDFQAFHLRTDTNGLAYSHSFSRNFIIEVKEVNHEFRLPEKNYSADKVARIEKRVRAGTEAIVLLYFKPLNAWRVVPHAVFLDRSKPSWDLRPYELVDWKRALSDFLGVLP